MVAQGSGTTRNIVIMKQVTNGLQIILLFKFGLVGEKSSIEQP
jgi:hypothetical protein